MKHIGYFLYFEGKPIYLNEYNDEFEVGSEDSEPDFWSHSMYSLFQGEISKTFPNFHAVPVYINEQVKTRNFEPPVLP